jgi:RsiW-degrading membrane proteinase PrsW (M82 family)
LIKIFGPAAILAVGLLPVIAFLSVLVALDSYKLVKLRVVVLLVVWGALAAGASYLISTVVFSVVQINLHSYSRYVAPLIEEALKGAIIVVLIRKGRIGFLIDAAILGFAAGAGFAMLENLFFYFSGIIPYTGLATWVIRGFGTAIMHGGATAIFAVMGLSLLEEDPTATVRSLWFGYAIAVVLHSAFNHGLLTPIHSTVAILVLLPPLFYWVFERSERRIGEWLGEGFDANAATLELINSGALSQSHVGLYLDTLKERFKGIVIADILCYLRLSTELGLRAKGILLMRENGFEVPIDAATREKFLEMDYLRGSIGPTGLLALQPMLPMSHKELWQLYMLGS